MYKREISNSDDILDSRDVEKRIEELEEERDSWQEDKGLPEYQDMEMPADKWTGPEWTDEQIDGWTEWEESSEGEELKTLKAFWDELEGYVSGGETLIRDSYFEQYARDFCDDVFSMGDVPDLIKNNVNWQGVAEDLQADYSSAEWDGVTYWFLAH